MGATTDAAKYPLAGVDAKKLHTTASGLIGWIGTGARNCIIKQEMRNRIHVGLLVFFMNMTAVYMGLAGCKSLPPSKPESEWTAEEGRGAVVFHRACAKCHYPTTTRGLRGPGLQAITKIKAMPSGAPPTDERLTAVILHGHGTMPSTTLDDLELHDLLAYLHTL